MDYQVNVFVYGKGRKLVGSYNHIVNSPNADLAAAMAQDAYKGQGDSIVVRGVSPAEVQVDETMPDQPRKRGRPRG